MIKIKMPTVHSIIIIFIVLLIVHSPAVADLPKASSNVLLTFTGKIAQTNAEGRAEFDRDLLERLEQTRLTTRTPWTEGEREFEGVSFATLLDMIDVTGSTARATAANDYVVDIPISELRNADALLALRMDGKKLRLRDKGPLWIIFPWSQHPELDRIEVHSYAVWQLHTIRIH